MKVFISNYKYYISPGFDIADNLYEKGKISENLKNKINNFLTNFWDWFNKKVWQKLRIEYVHVDRFDVYNMDNTLAKIIHPMLLELKNQDTSYPILGSEYNDCFSTELQIPDDFDTEFDDNFILKQRWTYVLDEMIYAFGLIAGEEYYNHRDNEEITNRMNRGLEYFGKFYTCLWN